MGRPIRQQKAGKGSSTYRAPSHRYKADLEHHKSEDDETVVGEIIELEHDPARSAPIARVRYEDGDERYVLVPEGVGVGDKIEAGVSASIEPGNTLPLAEIPEGVPVCNLELSPGDGGKIARSSGTSVTVVAHEKGGTVVQFPSGEIRRINPKCRATIGVVAGGGRTEKPFVKAGKKYHKVKSRGGKWPKVRGVAMNAVDHPFGGGGKQHPGRPKSVSHNTPPGRKVGDISSRRTGER
ncbi:MAG: 50S ribosomal protein L2 [Halobacteria archaeon]|nr:50S ribosomal protein L2 [Halobacteria archaeon]